jgi:hypothetical protein
VLST